MSCLLFLSPSFGSVKSDVRSLIAPPGALYRRPSFASGRPRFAEWLNGQKAGVLDKRVCDMANWEDRLTGLERTNRRLKRWLLVLSVAFGCGTLMAASQARDGVYDNLLVTKRLVVGEKDQPTAIIESQKGMAGISLGDKENRQRALLLYRQKGQVVSLVVNDRNGAKVFDASYQESGFQGRPVTTISLGQPADKGGLTISSAPDGHVGIVIRDGNGNIRSMMGSDGARTK
jgi:hypothetical protein